MSEIVAAFLNWVKSKVLMAKSDIEDVSIITHVLESVLVKVCHLESRQLSKSLQVREKEATVTVTTEDDWCS